VGRDGVDIDLIWVSGEGKYFCKQGWTGEITLIPQENFSLSRIPGRDQWVRAKRL
jgi:hypothetical protein